MQGRMSSSSEVLTSILLLAIAVGVAYAADPNQLQDFCPSSDDSTNRLFVNGNFCKSPTNVTVDDFYIRGLNGPANTGTISVLNKLKFPGLNTLGISVGRVYFAPNGGGAPPHIHPRGTEVFIVTEGTFYVGFVSFENKLFTKILNKGDVFIFPQGLLHFHNNIGKTPAYIIQVFSSQNPGVILVTNALFGSEPPISVDTLATAFQVDTHVIKDLQSKFTPHS